MEWTEIRIKKNPDVSDGQVDEWTILVAWFTEPIEKEVDAVLNATGSALWKLLDETDTLEGLTVRVCERYDVAREQARAEIAALVSSLAERRFLLLEDEFGSPVTPPGEDVTAAAQAE